MASSEALAELSIAGMAVLALSVAAHGVGVLPSSVTRASVTAHNTTSTSKGLTTAVLALETGAVLVFVWYLCLFSDWTLHKIGHLRGRWNGIYATHMRHHTQSYPCKKLLRPGPYHGEGGETAFLPPVALIWGFIWYLSPTRIAAQLIVCSFAFLLVSDHLHSQYHVKDSWLEPVLGEWFLERRRYHFHHHYRLQENMSLGGISTVLDRCIGSHWSDVNKAKSHTRT